MLRFGTFLACYDLARFWHATIWHVVNLLQAGVFQIHYDNLLRSTVITTNCYGEDTLRRVGTSWIRYVKLVRFRFMTTIWYVSDSIRRVGTFHRGERGVSTKSFPWLPTERDHELCLVLGYPAVMSHLQRQKALRGGQCWSRDNRYNWSV